MLTLCPVSCSLLSGGRTQETKTKTKQMNQYIQCLIEALPSMDRSTILRLVLEAPCEQARFICANHIDQLA